MRGKIKKLLFSKPVLTGQERQERDKYKVSLINRIFLILPRI